MRRSSRVLIFAMVAAIGVTFASRHSSARTASTSIIQLSHPTNMNETHDRLEITELLSRHQIYIDLKDPDRYASLYAPDGRYESPFANARGRADIAAMSRRLEASGFTKNKRHFTGPIAIDFDAADRATAFSYWWVADYTDKPSVFATGTYRDELRKLDGQWKIVHRVQASDPTGR